MWIQRLLQHGNLKIQFLKSESFTLKLDDYSFYIESEHIISGSSTLIWKQNINSSDIF